MRRVSLSIPVPAVVYDAARRILRSPRRMANAELDLKGDRDIEWAWVASQIPDAEGEALDFGPGGSYLSLIAADRGYAVTAVDQELIEWPYVHEGMTFLQGNIIDVPLDDEQFDLVLNCSTVEHVGLVGRYGVTQAMPEGDLQAMARMRHLMKPVATMILTIPVGRDAVFPPLHRVYGAERLPRLLDGFAVEREEYWLKNRGNRWVRASAEEALDSPPRERLYGLGCFVLSKS